MKTAADILANKGAALVTVSTDDMIYEALQKMTTRKIGAILVTEDSPQNIVGIWTERDLMRNSLEDGFNPRHARIGNYMSSPLHALEETATLAEIKDKMLGLFIRHMLIKRGETYVGILSVGDMIRASLLAQDEHIRELKERTSWQYYDNWGWQRQ